MSHLAPAQGRNHDDRQTDRRARVERVGFVRFKLTSRSNAKISKLGLHQKWLPLDGCVRISGDIGMPTQYIPIFIFAALAAAFPALSLVVFKLIRPTPL